MQCSENNCFYLISIRAFSEDYDKDLFKAHTGALYTGLLIHLDDASPRIQVLQLIIHHIASAN